MHRVLWDTQVGELFWTILDLCVDLISKGGVTVFKCILKQDQRPLFVKINGKAV